MKQYLLILPALLSILSSCAGPHTPAEQAAPAPAQTAGSPSPPVTPACISPEPAQKDIDRALSFAAAVLEPGQWQRSYSVAEGFVSVTWHNIPLSAVIYLEARIKPCGYGERDLDSDFSDENWRVILQNYDGHELIAECRTEAGLRLYQFKAHNQGLEYSIKYWVRSDTDHRVMTAMFVFPGESDSLLDEHASRLFPDLTNCSGE